MPRQKISDFPPDFQNELNRLLRQEVSTKPFRTVVVRMGRLSDHENEFEELIDSWNHHDYNTASQYYSLVLRGSFGPPLIASEPKGLLWDGYHRMWALRHAGIKVANFIYLNEQIADTE